LFAVVFLADVRGLLAVDVHVRNKCNAYTLNLAYHHFNNKIISTMPTSSRQRLLPPLALLLLHWRGATHVAVGIQQTRQLLSLGVELEIRLVAYIIYGLRLRR
jgi:hypothetical protein